MHPAKWRAGRGRGDEGPIVADGVQGDANLREAKAFSAENQTWRAACQRRPAMAFMSEDAGIGMEHLLNYLVCLPNQPYQGDLAVCFFLDV
jgi:hypothetical protein